MPKNERRGWTAVSRPSSNKPSCGANNQLARNNPSNIMTLEKYTQEMTRLTGAVTRARNKVAKLSTLAEKIAQKQLLKTAEEALRQHKLNRFVLVAD